jgi:hypothetical protein
VRTKNRNDHRPGNWRCRCGLSYRYAARGEAVVYWPALGLHAYRPEPVERTCIGCGGDLPQQTRSRQ